MNLQALGLTSWVPIIVLVLVGFLLGWLITGLPPRSKLRTASAGLAESDSRLKQANKLLASSQAHESELQNSLIATKDRLAEATDALTALQQETDAAHAHEKQLQAGLDDAGVKLGLATATVATLQQEAAGAHQHEQELQQALATREGELTDIRLQHSTLRTTAQQSYDAFSSQVQSLQADLQTACDENDNLKINLEGTARDLAQARADHETVTQTLANKDIALTEAYARAVRLERESTDRQSQLLTLQADQATLKRNLATLANTNQELNGRLQNARGEVANELAALTSTMLRVKDEQLAEANSTIAALQAHMSNMVDRPVSN